LSDAVLRLYIDDLGNIPLRICDGEELRLGVSGEFIDGSIETYEGDYDVVPNFEKQVLGTKFKRMADDVSVEAIPVYRVANPSGGNTVVIGG
jgi:hypothetical protein